MVRDRTTIQVTRHTLERLKAHQVYGESLDGVIRRLLDERDDRETSGESFRAEVPA